MNIEKVVNFMDRNFGVIIAVQLVSAASLAGLFFYVGYRVLKHFGIF